MNPEAALLLFVALALLLLVVLFWAWRRRVRRDALLQAPLGKIDDTAGILAAVPVLYVATTPHDEPLERLAIANLAFRSAGTLAVTAHGIGMTMPGAADIYFSRHQIHQITTATVAIDRVVENSGLLRLTWAYQNQAPVDSYFRPRTGSARALAEHLTSVLTPTESSA